MSKFGGFYKGEKKKKKKSLLEQKGNQLLGQENFTIPEIEILKKGKK